jgi:mannose-6-phosphate isomerase-like protein (cupin superfamily)
MDAFEWTQLIAQRAESGRSYLEFLRVPALSMGLYVLPPHSEDLQQPHTEDEVYYVVSGRAKIRVGAEEREAQAGSLIYVEAGVEHRFFDIQEELVTLVFFAPAEYSRAAVCPLS